MPVGLSRVAELAAIRTVPRNTAACCTPGRGTTHQNEVVEEQPLNGNQSAAVRIGDTLRRRAAYWTPAVHALLEHLRSEGFDAAPEPLGMDERRCPVAMLDWDGAGPGPRLWDVAWSAYAWVPLNTKGLGPDRVPMAARAARLRMFCEGYGGVRPDEVLGTLVGQLPFLAQVTERHADAGDPGSMKLASWNAPARARADADLIREQGEALLGGERSRFGARRV
jgi:hypothetical protein